MNEFSLIKSFKHGISVLLALQGVVVYSILLYWLLNESVAKRSEIFYWGHLFRIPDGSLMERLFDILMISLMGYILLGCAAFIVVALRGKNLILIYENRVSFPWLALPGYFTVKEIKFNEIKNISIKHVDRYYNFYSHNYWYLYLHLSNGKKYYIMYPNKRKPIFDEIHGMILERIAPEARLPPPPKTKRKLFFPTR